MNYLQAETIFNKCRNKANGAPLTGRATRLVKHADSYGIQYHGTIVVFIHRDGSYTLNSGGYRTSTTKVRINEYSPVQVFQKNFVWYTSDGQTFQDGMRVR